MNSVVAVVEKPERINELTFVVTNANNNNDDDFVETLQ